VISEIRETRHRISERFGHDPRRLVDYYVEQQRRQRSQSNAENLASEVSSGHSGALSAPAARVGEPEMGPA
jgi:hypothetical protein